jgi:hypothetical protein
VAIADEKQAASEKRFQARWFFVCLQTDKKETTGHFSSYARKFCSSGSFGFHKQKFSSS